MAEVTNSLLQKTYNSKDVNEIQAEIEIFTKKIEHEKINLRLSDERYHKQLDNYFILCGKPIPKTKEQKEKDRKEREKSKKKSKSLIHSIKKEAPVNEAQELFKDVQRTELENDRLTNEINNLQLDNKDLRKRIEDLRKEKLGVSTLLETIKMQRDSLKMRYEELFMNNEEAIKRMKTIDIDKVKNETYEERKEFEDNRDSMEEQYHKIVEENIKRSREQKKEALKKRFHYNAKQDDEQARLIAEEDISDRTPILDVLIEKWKFYNKFKKQMLDKYTKNAVAIKDAFERMIKYLGLDDFQELPVVLEKMEDQMSSIEMFISKLTNEVDDLENQKKNINMKIQVLKMKNNTSAENKVNFVDSKKIHIEKLKNQIRELKEEISVKRNFFTYLQPNTEDFLDYAQSTFISEFIQEKVAINRDVKFSESNIIEIIANIEDYQKLLEELDRNNPGFFDKKADILVNKDIEKLKNEMRLKLDQFRKDNYINSSIYGNMKTENKGANFDETIKKMADEILKVVNSQSMGKGSDRKKKQ